MLRRFLGWLRRLFGLPERREVLRLPTSTGAPSSELPADVVQEVVRRKGPLKPGHRRECVRDERLMPKPPRGFGAKKPKLLLASEARRLFAGTLRTKNRALRTLATDEAQLARFGLPLWRTEADLASALGLEVGQLRHFSIHRSRERVCHYVTYTIPKRSGGRRTISAPKRRLKAILRRLNRALVSKLPVSPHAHGFRPGRSVKTAAEPHVGKKVVLRLDLRDFFPSLSFARVRGLLIALGYGYPVAATLAALMTEAERQPVEVDGQTFFVPIGPRTCVQGAPTSPGLSNALVHRMDRRIAGIARRHGFEYTRYADDLSLSGASKDQAHRLRRAVERIIREEGFEVNRAKTRVMGRGRRQLVAGVTVNEVLGLSRAARRRLRAALHQAETSGASPERRRQLDGYLAWVAMLNPRQADALRSARARRPEGEGAGSAPPDGEA